MINLKSESTFTTAVLIADAVQSPGGSSDSIPAFTVDSDGNPVDAALEVQSTQGALLIPRMTVAQINDLNAADGMIVYDKTSNDFGIRQNGTWETIGTGAGDVEGPDGAVPNNIAIFADDTGKVISDSGVNIVAIAPPEAFARKALAKKSSGIALEAVDNVIQVANLGVLKFINGVGLVFVDNSCPMTFYESGDIVSTIITGTTAAESGPTNDSCLLEIQSTTGALVPSRMTTAQINDLTATDGMVAYNTDIGQMQISQGGYWGQFRSKVANIKRVQLASGPYTAQSTDSVIVAEANLEPGTLAKVFLPASPVTGETYTVVDGGGTAEINNIYIDGGGNAINEQALVTKTIFTPIDGSLQNGVFTPNGQYFYVTDNANGCVYVYKNASSANPVLLTTIYGGSQPLTIAVTPNGNYVYVCNQSEQFAVIEDASTDNAAFLMNFSVPNVLGNPFVITPDGNYLYVLSSIDYIYVFQGISSGSPSLLTTITVTSDPIYSPSYLSVTPDGNYVYITNTFENKVVVIQNASSATPTVLTNITTGARPTFLDISPDGNYVCTGNSGTNHNCSIIQNASTGSPSLLTSVSVAATAIQIYALKFTPNGKYVYVSTATGLSVISFETPSAPVLLKALPNVGTRAFTIAMSPFGNYVYFSGNLGSFPYFSIVQDAQSDDSELLVQMPTNGQNVAVCMSQDGNYCYALNNVGDPGANIMLIQNASNGIPVVPYVQEEVLLSGSPPSMAVTPNGKYAYVPAPSANLVYVLQNADTNNPSVLTALIVPSAQYVAISPTGQYAYVFDGGSNVYQLGGVSSGFPVVLNTFDIYALGSYAITSPSMNNIVFTPDGSYLYLAALNPAFAFGLLSFSDASTASPTLYKNTAWPNTSCPVSIAITPDGYYLYGTSTQDGTSIIRTYQFANASQGTTGTVLNTFTFGTDSYTNQLRITPDGSRLYIFATNTGLITIIGGASTDTPNPTPIGTISTASPTNIIFTGNGSYAYVAKNSGSTVAIQNASSGTPSILATLGANSNGGIAQSSDGYYVVAILTSGVQRATFIAGANTSTPAVLPVYVPISGPSYVTSSPTTGNMFVVSTTNNKVSVLSTAGEQEPAITTNFGSQTLIFDGNIWLSSPGF